MEYSPPPTHFCIFCNGFSYCQRIHGYVTSPLSFSAAVFVVICAFFQLIVDFFELVACNNAQMLSFNGSVRILADGEAECSPTPMFVGWRGLFLRQQYRVECNKALPLLIDPTGWISGYSGFRPIPCLASCRVREGNSKPG